MLLKYYISVVPRAEQVAILDDDDDDDGDDDDDDDDDFGGCGGGGDHYGDDDDLLTFEFQTPGFAIVIDRRSGTWQEIQVRFPKMLSSLIFQQVHPHLTIQLLLLLIFGAC